MEAQGLYRLPAELRAHIWHLCLPGPRHIIIPQRPLRRLKTPNVFHICHEARSEAGRHYELVPSTLEEHPKDSAEVPHSELIWINFTKDILCIEGDWMPSRASSELLRRTQRLAFEFRAPQNFMQLLEILAPIHQHLSAFPSLREMLLYSLP